MRTPSIQFNLKFGDKLAPVSFDALDSDKTVRKILKNTMHDLGVPHENMRSLLFLTMAQLANDRDMALEACFVNILNCVLIGLPKEMIVPPSPVSYLPTLFKTPTSPQPQNDFPLDNSDVDDDVREPNCAMM